MRRRTTMGKRLTAGVLGWGLALSGPVLLGLPTSTGAMGGAEAWAQTAPTKGAASAETPAATPKEAPKDGPKAPAGKGDTAVKADKPLDAPSAVAKPGDKPAEKAGESKPADKPADKEGDLVKAREAYAAGESKFKAGQFADALKEFLVADGIRQSPNAARYIAVCHDKLGNYTDAGKMYERFLANVPPKLATEGEEAKKRLEVIKAMPARVHVESTPPGAALTVDGKSAATMTPAELELAPGKHQLQIALEGHVTKDETLEVAYAEKKELKVELAPEPKPAPVEEAKVVAAPPPPPPPLATKTSGSSRVPALVIGGVAVASAGVGAFFGVKALQTKSDFDKTPTVELADKGENQALVADMALGVAVTLAVTSVVLLVTGDEAPQANAKSGATLPSVPRRSATSFSVAPVVTSHGGGAGALLRF